MRRRWWLGLPILVAAVAVTAIALAQSGGSGPVGVFPAPDTEAASPRTELSFRGVSAGSLGDVTVTGERSGVHQARAVPHPDGDGVSLVFDEAFQAPERVTVDTKLEISGAQNGDFSFMTATRPREGLGSSSPPPRNLLRALTGQRGKPPRGSVPRYRTRPDLRPPEVQITRRPKRGTAPGLIFLSPKTVFGARPRPGLQGGGLIADQRGEPVWFLPSGRSRVNDLRVQQYKGEPVLTWWQGRQVLGTGEGVVQIVDRNYRSVKRVRAGNGYAFDFHEVTLTKRGTLLALVYSPVDKDLRSVGGARNGRVIDSVVQEIDVETGRVLFEWHSLGTVGLDESYGRVPPTRAAAFDYFHVNSVTEDTDGNLLISGRETWGVYKLNRRTGQIMWRLGGKKSDFAMSKAAVFAWQHDAQRDPDGTIRIFDNEAAPKVREKSRVLSLRLDEDAKTARIAGQLTHPDDLLSGTQGNAQRLPNGNTFVGWGSQGYFTEYSRGGRLLFDGRVARGNDSYRAYRQPWSAVPRGRPDIAVFPRSGGRIAVYGSWNGDTRRKRWDVLAGTSRDSLRKVRSKGREGFEDAVSLPRRSARYVALRAVDADGDVLGTSVVKRVPR